MNKIQKILVLVLVVLITVFNFSGKVFAYQFLGEGLWHRVGNQYVRYTPNSYNQYNPNFYSNSYQNNHPNSYQSNYFDSYYGYNYNTPLHYNNHNSHSSHSSHSSHRNDEPEVNTGSVTNITDESAKVRGEVDMNDFENGKVFFVYGED